MWPEKRTTVWIHNIMYVDITVHSSLITSHHTTFIQWCFFFDIISYQNQQRPVHSNLFFRTFATNCAFSKAVRTNLPVRNCPEHPKWHLRVHTYASPLPLFWLKSKVNELRCCCAQHTLHKPCCIYLFIKVSLFSSWYQTWYRYVFGVTTLHSSKWTVSKFWWWQEINAILSE